MKSKEALKKNRKKVIIITVVTAFVLIIAVAALCFWFFRGRQEVVNKSFDKMQGGRGNIAVTEGMIAASGVTSVGITEESFDVENLTTGLEIEELYISSETEITEGTKVLKLSEESIAEARAELEQVLKEADLAYRSGAIEYEQSKITAAYNRDSKLLAGKQAQAVYEETISGLQDAVDKAQEKVTEAKEQIAEYQSYVNNGTYREYFEIDKYEEIYDTNLYAIEAKLEEWGLTWSQITGQGGGASGRVAGGQTASASDIQALSNMYKILEDNMEDLERAVEDYEDAVANASLQLQTLELQLPGLEQELAEAKEKYETQILQAKLTYETSLANAESAESDYETAIQKAESDYETLMEAKEDAEENLALFENTVGDGYFYASGSGTILRTMVRAGRNLTSEAVVFMYSNSEEMTVTVSVDQADISKIALGDAVYIQSGESGGFQGNVTEVNPVSESGSRTSVTYDVKVTFDGESGMLSANESVTVIFGMDAEGQRPQRPEGGMDK